MKELTPYQSKLRDPRWQKKRLEILNRDEFTCQSCFDSESTLHVHHRYYSSCDPWDTENKALVTLCETCHEAETLSMKDSERQLIEALKVNFLSYDISEIAFGFEMLNYRGLCHIPGIISAAIYALLSDESATKKMVEEYLALPHAKKRRV